jgi:hypothetical protein
MSTTSAAITRPARLNKLPGLMFATARRVALADFMIFIMYPNIIQGYGTAYNFSEQGSVEHCPLNSSAVFSTTASG